MEAILLRQVAYGDNDRVLTLLTDREGKVSVLARGARTSKKRFEGGALEPFGVIDAEIVLGNAELGRLVSARLTRGFPRLLGSLERMEQAGAGLELVRELVPFREADPRLLSAITELLEQLNEEDAGFEVRLGFELRFLSLVGLCPRLDTCGRCGRFAEHRAGLFDADIGALVCRACGGGPIHLGGRTRARMIACQGDDWAAQTHGWSDVERHEAREAIEAFLRKQLGKARHHERWNER